MTRTLEVRDAPLEGEDVREVQQRLHLLGYGDLVRVNGVYDEASAKAVRCFQIDNALPVDGTATPETQERLAWHLSSDEGWVRRAVRAATALLALDGKRLVFGDAHVRGEVERAAEGAPVGHNCDPGGVFLHPHMLETALALADLAAFSVDVLRTAHGKFQKIDDVTVCEPPPGAIVSSHFIGQGIDFYRIGDDVSRLVSRDEGEAAWCEAAERVVRPFWDAALKMPPRYWVVFPEGLADRYDGIRHQIKFFSNDRHWNHTHIGLNMNIKPRPGLE